MPLSRSPHAVPIPLLAFCSLNQLLHCDALGQVPREVHIKALHHCQPVGDQLQRDDIEDALQDIDGLGDFDAQALARIELLIVGIADNDWLAAACND
jgi:hypothetical protein